MKTLKAEFIKGAADAGGFPQLNLPEIAFSGRSNVGKSSLLNSIVLRKNLARTSSSPGKTRQINFFLVEEKWVFADLPGFGYASIGKAQRLKWAELNFEYFEKRDSLRLVCALTDSRHDPSEYDLALWEHLENIGRRFLIVMTKTDKITSKAVADRKEQIEGVSRYCSHCVEALPYSSVKGVGREQLLAIIRKNTEI